MFITAPLYFGGENISTFNDLINLLQEHIRSPRIKVELLYPNLEVCEEITQDINNTDGSLKITFQNGIRRTVTLTINNPIKKYNFSPSSLWMTTYFRVSTGYAEIDYWQLQGTFAITDSNMYSRQSNKTIVLNGVDLMGLLNGSLGGTLKSIYEIPAGQYMKDALLAIISDATLNVKLNYDVVFEGYTIPYTMTFNRGESYFTIIEQLCNLRSSNCYFDVWGNFCFLSGVEDLDDTTKGTVYAFSKTGDEPNYISGEIDFSVTSVKNSVLVVGMTVDGSIYQAEIKDLDLTSPTRIQLIGERPMIPIEDENINSDQLCLDRANYELKKNRIKFISASIICNAVDYLDVNQVIEITDPDLNIFDLRLLIQSIDFPLKTGSQMTLTCSSINNIIFANT